MDSVASMISKNWIESHVPPKASAKLFYALLYIPTRSLYECELHHLFIMPPCIRGEVVEDIGGSHFEVLIKKSFSGKIRFQHIMRYQMHELPHELAQFVSA
ncbi:hypothetical protein IEQ34_020818 [Dendrobium chrysotoxum]|uniref:Uncharacterized protein n=1 Tax=Dendrobium chrysotoxum TaxID=161865 RepID=A0AAV7G1Z8_DENCH|nr:hypothetical protein IEQ34_020818 [Dendrobium chrysotoxum]